eukprot:TRINITY_DN1034_c0_g3_i2.p1 TRINITY_DN1034_c0_g3~~TRINITY_DN1034_c0_g3_i2.p1  ORF type:complete len:680 (+),score=126.75 TRINITY_DN1034_c0_g3_i2:253-2292(+)
MEAAVEKAVALIEDILKGGARAAVPAEPSCMVFPNLENAEPAFNLIGRLRGANDQFLVHIAKETGARVLLRGRGSGNLEGRGLELPEPLHIWICHPHPKGLDDARRLAQNLVDTIRGDYYNQQQSHARPHDVQAPSPYNPAPLPPPVPNYSVQPPPAAPSGQPAPFPSPYNPAPLPPPVPNYSVQPPPAAPSGQPAPFPSPSFGGLSSSSSPQQAQAQPYGMGAPPPTRPAAPQQASLPAFQSAPVPPAYPGTTPGPSGSDFAPRDTSVYNPPVNSEAALAPPTASTSGWGPANNDAHRGQGSWSDVPSGSGYRPPAAPSTSFSAPSWAPGSTVPAASPLPTYSGPAAASPVGSYTYAPSQPQYPPPSALQQPPQPSFPGSATIARPRPYETPAPYSSAPSYGGYVSQYPLSSQLPASTAYSASLSGAAAKTAGPATGPGYAAYGGLYTEVQGGAKNQQQQQQPQPPPPPQQQVAPRGCQSQQPGGGSNQPVQPQRRRFQESMDNQASAAPQQMAMGGPSPRPPPPSGPGSGAGSDTPYRQEQQPLSSSYRPSAPTASGSSLGAQLFSGAPPPVSFEAAAPSQQSATASYADERGRPRFREAPPSAPSPLASYAEIAPTANAWASGDSAAWHQPPLPSAMGPPPPRSPLPSAAGISGLGARDAAASLRLVDYTGEEEEE